MATTAPSSTTAIESAEARIRPAVSYTAITYLGTRHDCKPGGARLRLSPHRRVSEGNARVLPATARTAIAPIIDMATVDADQQATYGCIAGLALALIGLIFLTIHMRR